MKRFVSNGRPKAAACRISIHIACDSLFGSIPSSVKRYHWWDQAFSQFQNSRSHCQFCLAAGTHYQDSNTTANCELPNQRATDISRQPTRMPIWTRQHLTPPATNRDRKRYLLRQVTAPAVAVQAKQKRLLKPLLMWLYWHHSPDSTNVNVAAAISTAASPAETSLFNGRSNFGICQASFFLAGMSRTICFASGFQTCQRAGIASVERLITSRIKIVDSPLQFSWIVTWDVSLQRTRCVQISLLYRTLNRLGKRCRCSRVSNLTKSLRLRH